LEWPYWENDSQPVPRSYNCKDCSKTYNSNSHLREHIRNVHMKRKNPLVCTVCQKEYNSANSLRGPTDLVVIVRSAAAVANLSSWHYPRTVGSSYLKPFQCHLCIKSFRLKRNLIEHVQNVHMPMDPLICSYCNKSFKNPSSLRGHIHVAHKWKGNNDARRFAGGLDVTFEGLPSTRRWAATKAFPCKLCLKSFGSKSRLVDHLKYVHGPTEPLICSYCNGIYKHYNSLRKHIWQTHRLVRGAGGRFVATEPPVPHRVSSLKQFACKQCRKKFSRKDNLSEHEHNVHGSAAPVVCRFCGHMFKHWRSLRGHTYRRHADMLAKLPRRAKWSVWHANRARFPCKWCHKLFNTVVLLKTHERNIHERAKPVRCHFCQKMFRHRNSLSGHISKNHRTRP
ncbi:UNVERIFIED_CONTAM: hypothetical protein B566_EDAN019462, partial [Ephemera danica]